jgi:hypothetical protein
MKFRLDALGSAQIGSGAQNIKIGPDALTTVEKESGSGKLYPTPSEPPNMSPGAENMKIGPHALGTAENESGGVKYEN